MQGQGSKFNPEAAPFIRYNPDAPPFVPRLSVIASLPPPSPLPPPPLPQDNDGVIRLSLKKEVVLSAPKSHDALLQKTAGVQDALQREEITITSDLLQRKEPFSSTRLPFRKFVAETPLHRLTTLVSRVQQGKRQIEADKRNAPFSSEVNPDGSGSSSNSEGAPYYLYSYSVSSNSASQSSPTLSTKEFVSIDTRAAWVCEASALNDVVKLEEYSRTWSREEWTSALLSKNKRGDAPIHVSCRRGAEAAAEYLLYNGADIRAKTGAGLKCSPIHLVVSRGSNNLLRSLINNGADVQARDSYRRTPLHYASSALGDNHIVCMEMLLHAGCDINAMDEDGITPLLYAAACKNIAAVRLLVAQGAGILTKIEPLLRSSGNAFEVTGGAALSPIHNLCESGQNIAVRSILKSIESSYAPDDDYDDYDDDDDDEDNDDKEALYRINIHAILASRQGSPFSDDTVLHAAIRSRSILMVKTILKFARRSLCLHLIIELRNSSGYTPLQLACSENRNDASMRSILASLVATTAWLTKNTISPVELPPLPLLTATTARSSFVKASRLSIVTMLVVKGQACLEPAIPQDAPLLRMTPPSPLAIAIASGDLDVSAFLLGAGSKLTSNAIYSLSKLTRKKEIKAAPSVKSQGHTVRLRTVASSSSSPSSSSSSSPVPPPLSPPPPPHDVGQLKHDEKVEETMAVSDLSFLLESGLGSDVRISPVIEPETGWQSSSSLVSLFDALLSTDPLHKNRPTGFDLQVQMSTNSFLGEEETAAIEGETTLKLHAELLSLRSSFLRALLFGSGAEATLLRDRAASSDGDQDCSVDLCVPSLDALKLVVSYLYTGRINTSRSRAINVLWSSVSTAIANEDLESSGTTAARLSQIEMRALPDVIIYFDAALLAHKLDIPDLLFALEDRLLDCAQGAALVEIGQELLKLTSSEIGSRLIAAGEAELDTFDHVTISLSPTCEPLDSKRAVTSFNKDRDNRDRRQYNGSSYFANLRTGRLRGELKMFKYELSEIYVNQVEEDAEGYDIALSVYNALGLLKIFTLQCSSVEAPLHAIGVADRIARTASCLCSLIDSLSFHLIKFIKKCSSSNGSNLLSSSPKDLFRIIEQFEGLSLQRMNYDERNDKTHFPIHASDVIPFALFVIAVKELRFLQPEAASLWRCAQRELKAPLFLKPTAACLSITCYGTTYSCRFPAPFLLPYMRFIHHHTIDDVFNCNSNSSCTVTREQVEQSTRLISNALRNVVKFICGDAWAVFSTTSEWPHISYQEATTTTAYNKTSQGICIHCLQQVGGATFPPPSSTSTSPPPSPPLIPSLLVLLFLSAKWNIPSLTSILSRHLCRYAENIIEELLVLTISKTSSYVTALSTILCLISDVLPGSTDLSSISSICQIALLRVLSDCVKTEMKKVEFQLHLPAKMMEEADLQEDTDKRKGEEDNRDIVRKNCFVTAKGTQKVLLHVIAWAMRR